MQFIYLLVSSEIMLIRFHVLIISRVIQFDKKGKIFPSSGETRLGRRGTGATPL